MLRPNRSTAERDAQTACSAAPLEASSNARAAKPDLVARTAARPGDGAGPARALQAKLEAHIALQEVEVQRWPGAARLTFIIGTSLGLWALAGALLVSLL
ncbi:MAG: hypothetical protein ACK4Z5_01125 [Brevundimonas sp.]